MSFDSLLNKVCSWTRKISSSVDQYGAQKIVETSISTNIRCRVDPILSKKELEDLGIVGETSQSYERMFLDDLPDIQEGDIVTIVGDNSGNRKVILAQNAGGHNHHSEVILEKLRIS